MKYSISMLSTSPTQTRTLTPSTLRSAFAQTAFIGQLGWVLPWKPRLAMFLRELVLCVRPHFGRA
jgi:hypothetical protein